jgi:hypothetical protein
VPVTVTGRYDAHGNERPIIGAAHVVDGRCIDPIDAPGLPLIRALDREWFIDPRDGLFRRR